MTKADNIPDHKDIWTENTRSGRRSRRSERAARVRNAGSSATRGKSRSQQGPGRNGELQAQPRRS